MISNKALATLFFITLNMQCAAASSPEETQKPNPSGISVLQVRKPGRASKPKDVLVDTTNTVRDVEVQGSGTEMTGASQGQPVSQVSEFGELIKQENYKKIGELGKKMNDEEFLKQLCPVVETLEHYNGVVSYLRRWNLVASFYVYGDIRVVKEAIVASRVYDNDYYVKDGDLETALPLAFKEDRHDRVIELLDVRKGITAEGDEQRKRGSRTTSFEWFVFRFLANLAPWCDGMALKRFFTLRGDGLRNQHPDILDALCQELVAHLSHRLDNPKAETLLVDLIGRPLLLTPAVFAGGFLKIGDDENLSSFIKYSWSEAIQEGLRVKDLHGGGEKLWRMMKIERPDRFSGKFPDTEEARAIVCVHFPTRKELGERLAKKSADSTSPSDALRQNFSGKPTPPVKRRGRASRVRGITSKLRVTASTVENVSPVNNQITTRRSLYQRLYYWIMEPIDEKFERLFRQKKYKAIVNLGKKMEPEEFLKQLCPVVETLEQYNGIVGYLKRNNLVASFYVYGDIEVVKGAIVASRVYDKKDYVEDGNLEKALSLALENDLHDRVIELLDVRQVATAKKDEQLKLKGWRISFEWFVRPFLHYLAPWEDGEALRRFLILCGEELRSKYPDILDILFEHLVSLLSVRLHLPKAKILLVDLIGQPLLLTPAVFARGFLNYDDDEYRSAFIEYGWRETIKEGLKTECYNGSKKLWRVMKEERPSVFVGEFPDTADALAAVLAKFPTRKELRERWAKRSADSTSPSNAQKP